MSNTETIKIQHDSAIDIYAADADNEIRLTTYFQDEEMSVYLTKEQAQQIIDTLQAFIS